MTKKKRRPVYIKERKTPLPDPPACPACRTVLDGIAVLSVGGPENQVQPETGDATFCVYCSAVLIFVTPSRLRLVTDDEFQDFHPDVQLMLSMMKAKAAFFGSKRHEDSLH